VLIGWLDADWLAVEAAWACSGVVSSLGSRDALREERHYSTIETA